MAYVAVTTGEIAEGAAALASTMSKIKVNQDGFSDGTAIVDNAIIQRHIAAGAIHQGELDTTIQNATYTTLMGAGATFTDSFTLTSPLYTIGYSYRGYSATVIDDDTTVSLNLGSPADTGLNSSYAAFSHVVQAVRFNDSSFSDTTSIDIDINYINSSPPYNLGHGDIPLFVFALLDSSGNIVGVINDGSPPWVYNGPTKATAQYKREGKPFLKKKTISEEDGGIIEEEVEVTQDLKNADMNIIPHPFIPKDGQSVILLDPAETLQLADIKSAGESVNKILLNDYLRIDNQPITRNGPAGLRQVKFKWKDTKRKAGAYVKDKREGKVR